MFALKINRQPPEKCRKNQTVSNTKYWTHVLMQSIRNWTNPAHNTYTMNINYLPENVVFWPHHFSVLRHSSSIDQCPELGRTSWNGRIHERLPTSPWACLSAASSFSFHEKDSGSEMNSHRISCIKNINKLFPEVLNQSIVSAKLSIQIIIQKAFLPSLPKTRKVIVSKLKFNKVK